MSGHPYPLPADLPVPVDDGAADHLAGMRLPSVELASTDGTNADLARLRGWWVISVYPMTGRPGVPLPDGWDALPGARGRTPQSCGFRDHHAELRPLGAGVFGLGAQSSECQREARDRLRLPFQLPSDCELRAKRALRLPTFGVAGTELYKRLTVLLSDGTIRKLFYPVFPPDRNADEVLDWLRAHAGARDRATEPEPRRACSAQSIGQLARKTTKARPVRCIVSN